MEIFSVLLAICAGNSPVPGELPTQSHWRGALMFSLICVWINGWVKNREAGDLSRYRAHYDVTVMWALFSYLDPMFALRCHRKPKTACSSNFVDDVFTVVSCRHWWRSTSASTASPRHIFPMKFCITEHQFRYDKPWILGYPAKRALPAMLTHGR